MICSSCQNEFSGHRCNSCGQMPEEHKPKLSPMDLILEPDMEELEKSITVLVKAGHFNPSKI